MAKKWRLTDRTRTLLTLELAIVLPAAALMAFSVWNLRHMQRDQAIEAAIQRDFTHVLKIAEKKSWERANKLLEPVREDYPNPDDGSQIKAKLDRVLLEHPELSYAVLYDKKNNLLVSSMQSSGDHDGDFCARAQDEINSVQSWLPLEASDMSEKLRMMAEKGEQSAGFHGGWSHKGDRHVYSNEAYFIPPGVSKDRVSLGVVSFDQDYLQKTFFPRGNEGRIEQQEQRTEDRCKSAGHDDPCAEGFDSLGSFLPTGTGAGQKWSAPSLIFSRAWFGPSNIPARQLQISERGSSASILPSSPRSLC